jgi:hypothetical protein
VLGYLVYLESFWNSRFGYGATLSVAILVISILMATFVMKKLMKGPSMSDVAIAMRQRSLVAGKLIGLMLLGALVFVWLGPIISRRHVIKSTTPSGRAVRAADGATFRAIRHGLECSGLAGSDQQLPLCDGGLGVGRDPALVPSFALSRFDVRASSSLE